jgi:nicotinate phosphoribosyltransferase
LASFGFWADDRQDGVVAKRARRTPEFGWVTSRNVGLLTDLYELTMAQSYWRLGMNEEATFDLFVREAPPNRRFLVSAGLEPALAVLRDFRFDKGALEYLSSLGRFDDAFLAWIGGTRFTGDVWAIPEGEPFLPNEPLLRVDAPLIEAQLVETALLNTIIFQSGIASKAARVVIAARGRSVVDFGARRTHGADASLKAARAAYAAGCDGTSNMLAGRLFGIPLYGTMAHSYVMAFEEEIDAFRAYAEEFPDGAVLLIDTYDTIEGARRAARVGREMRERGRSLRGVRLDSGDIGSLSVAVRGILDEAGLADAQIIASGDLNEWRIADLTDEGAPVDAFGVGTEMVVAKDAPALGGVYKLVEYAGRGRLKRSPGKGTRAGRKQVWRAEGLRDTIALEGERVEGAEPLLQPVMRRGRVAVPLPSLSEIRERCLDRLKALPQELRDLTPCDAGSAPQAAVTEALRNAGADESDRRL